MALSGDLTAAGAVAEVVAAVSCLATFTSLTAIGLEVLSAVFFLVDEVFVEEEVEAVAESFLACCIAALLTYAGVTTTDCFSICSKSSLGNNCA